MVFRLLFLCAILIIIELYAFQALRTVVKVKWLLMFYQILSLFLFAFIIYSFTQFDRSIGQTKQTLLTMGLLLLVYLPKIVIALVLFGEDIYRVIFGSVNYLIDVDATADFLPSRRKFVSQLALGLAAVPFLSLIY